MKAVVQKHRFHFAILPLPFPSPTLHSGESSLGCLRESHFIYLFLTPQKEEANDSHHLWLLCGRSRRAHRASEQAASTSANTKPVAGKRQPLRQGLGREERPPAALLPRGKFSPSPEQRGRRLGVSPPCDQNGA